MSDKSEEPRKSIVKRVVDWLFGRKSWKGPDPGYRMPRGPVGQTDFRTPGEKGFGKNP